MLYTSSLLLKTFAHFFLMRKLKFFSLSGKIPVSHYRGNMHIKQQKWCHLAPSWETALKNSVCVAIVFNCLWASVLYLDLSCASVTKMCPKMSENLKWACKDVMMDIIVSVVLNEIKTLSVQLVCIHRSYNLHTQRERHFLGVWEILKTDST